MPGGDLFDRPGGLLSLASREAGDPTSPPIAADGGATQPSLNYGGEELLFVSRSNNLNNRPHRGSRVYMSGDDASNLTRANTN